jgi:hypothetical protein
MADKSKWKNKNRDILKEEIYDPTITDPPKPPELPKELKSKKKKFNKGGKV